MTAAAVEAFKQYDALNCWGNFSTRSLWKSFQRACKVARVAGARPYDLRHTFGTMVSAQTGDPKAVQELLLHSAPKVKTTKRYTQGAVPTRLRLAVDSFDRALEGGTMKPRNVARHLLILTAVVVILSALAI